MEYPPNENTAGGRLRIYRKSKGYNIVNFSKLLKISQGSLSDIENNKSKPSATPIDNLIHNTDINIYWLFTGEGEMIRRDEKADTYIYKERDSKPQALDDDPEIAELLARARKVLKSGNRMAYESLERNILYFAHVIEIEKRFIDMESRLEALEEIQRKKK